MIIPRSKILIYRKKFLVGNKRKLKIKYNRMDIMMKVLLIF